MANKTYFAKVYNKTRTSVYQYIDDGDYEGFAAYGTSQDGAMQPVGAFAQVYRDRNDAYPTATATQAFVFDGVGSYIDTPSVGQGSINGSPSVTYTTFTQAFWLYKSNWNDGVQQVIYNNNATYGSGGTGMTAELNIGTAGSLTVSVNIGGTQRTATMSLSGIATGFHHLAFGSDARFLKVYWDGAQVGSVDTGSTTSVSNPFDSYNNTIGCKLVITSTYTRSKFFVGAINDWKFYTTLLNAADITKLYLSKSPIGISSKVALHYDFDNLQQTNLGAPFASGFVTNSNQNGAYVNFSVGINGTIATMPGNNIRERSSMLVTSASGATTQTAQSQTMTVTNGSQYTIGVYVKGTSGDTLTLGAYNVAGSSVTTSTTMTANGQWQPFVLTFTAASTSYAVQISTNNATTPRIVYMDKLAVNSGTTAYPYFTRASSSSGGSIYTYDSTVGAALGTFTTFTYINTWKNEISNDIEYDLEINSAGAQMEIDLARDPTNFGEQVDVDFDLDVRVFCVDDNAPNSVQVFRGYIADYIPDLVNGLVKVITFSYGAELDNYQSQAGAYQTGIMPINNGNYQTLSAYGFVFNIPITPTADITLDHIVMSMSYNGTLLSGLTNYSNNIKIYKGDPSTDSVNVTTGLATFTTTNTLVATASGKTPVGTTPGSATYTFSSNPVLYKGQQYYVSYYDTIDQMRIGGATTAADAPAISNFPPFGQAYWADATVNNSTFTVAKNSAMACPYIELWQTTGSTTVAYTNTDPSTMLLQIMNDYSLQGGTLQWDTTSIQMTNTPTSYTFTSMSTYGCIQKILDLAPIGWYFYVDPTDNKLHFQQKSSTPNYKFKFGIDFGDTLSFEKRTESMINAVYFTGGIPAGSTTNLYRVYRDKTSIAKYGQHRLPYNDGRVTLKATADTIANNLIYENNAPEIRTNLTIMDGYDIETIKGGGVVGFQNYGGNSDSTSTWDVGQWDVSNWDADITNPNTLQLQIARMHYSPDKVTMTLSTVPPDVNKRIEQIGRMLDAQQTLANPSVPTSS